MTQAAVMPMGLPVKGKYTVELRDDRTGKLKHRVEKENYITPIWEIYAKAMQLSHWLTYGFPYDNGTLLWRAGQSLVDPTGSGLQINPFFARNFPLSSIMLTDWTDAENTAEHWLKGELIAWASMWKSASVPAAGTRGQINEAECSVTANGSVWKWVWDWSTQQGNGSYQTLAMGIPSPKPDGAVIKVACGPYFLHGNKNNLGFSVAVTYLCGVGYNPITRKWVVLGNTSTTAYLATATDLGTQVANSDADGSGLGHDLESLTWSSIAGVGGITITTATSNTVAIPNGLGVGAQGVYPCADGSILVFHGARSAGYSRLIKMNASGTNLWTQAVGATSSSTWFTNTAHTYANMHSVVEVGSFYYICMGSNQLTTVHASVHADYKKVLRINPADGTVSATVALPAEYHIHGGMTTDGTDLFILTNRGLVKMTTAGVILENYGYPTPAVVQNDTLEKGLSPWPTDPSNLQYEKFQFVGDQESFGIAPLNNFEEGIRYQTHRSGLLGNLYTKDWDASFSAHGTTFNDSWKGRPFFWNGRLWMGSYNGPNFGVNWSGVSGANMLSRTLLDAPVTKNSSQTMKVSYELTMPNLFTLVHDHPAV